MSDISFVPEVLLCAVMISALWPGFDFRPNYERPKKGYWTVGSVFWPLKRAYLGLWPEHPALGKAALRLRGAAGLVVCVVQLALFIPGVSKAVDQRWYLVEIAVAAFLVGRASGFLGAARVVADEGSGAGSGSRTST